jgi:hypothetical protein
MKKNKDVTLSRSDFELTRCEYQEEDATGPIVYFFMEVDATVYRSRCDWFWNIQKSLRVFDGSDSLTVARLKKRTTDQGVS